MELKTKEYTHPLVDGGVTSAGGHPDLLVELIADWIRNIDGGICVSAEDRPDGHRGRVRHTKIY